MEPDRAALFVTAQAPVLDTVRAELRAGRKTSHWMWYIFPQLAVLGRSDTAKRYGLRDLDEAAAFLEQPELGPVLAENAALLLEHEGQDATAIMGDVDALKLRSSMTLFALVQDAPPEFGAVLDMFYDSEMCPLTLRETGRE